MPVTPRVRMRHPSVQRDGLAVRPSKAMSVFGNGKAKCSLLQQTLKTHIPRSITKSTIVQVTTLFTLIYMSTNTTFAKNKNDLKKSKWHLKKIATVGTDLFVYLIV